MSALRDAYERRLARQLGSPRMSTMERCTQREWAAERASGYQTPLTKKLRCVQIFLHEGSAVLPWVRAEDQRPPEYVCSGLL